ncbi:hypothetical protein MRB53_011462 [Persea americana]|uniref:Uncharacterized protein n=1 Tax=Persea americana TaxID=3435 RepID=A0ACC2LUW6_PERAE|nr:hypothetical protein MRB53_011462 [Persea americana]
MGRDIVECARVSTSSLAQAHCTSYELVSLHYASTIGYNDDDNRRKWILEVLIQTEPSLAYKSDKDGNYPLLIATIEAPFAAVEMILKHCPDSAELVDRSGRNALHLAVLNNRVSSIGSLIKRPEFKMLINQPDNDGNTPICI